MRVWKEVNKADIENIEADTIDLIIKFIRKNYLQRECGIASRIVDDVILRDLAREVKYLVDVYHSINQYDALDDEKQLANSSAEASNVLGEINKLAKLIPDKQIDIFLRYRQLSKFISASDLLNMLDDAKVFFDGLSRKRVGKPPNLNLNFATTLTIDVLQIILGRDFRRDLKVAKGGFVNLDAELVYQILVFLDPANTRARVKSALLNFLSSTK